jgi:ribosomal protein S2
VNFSLYSEVKTEMLFIQKRVLSGDDEFANIEWTNIRDQIKRLAASVKVREQELKEERKRERADYKREQKELSRAPASTKPKGGVT